jgi:hypothetical protein
MANLFQQISINHVIVANQPKEASCSLAIQPSNVNHRTEVAWLMNNLHPRLLFPASQVLSRAVRGSVIGNNQVNIRTCTHLWNKDGQQLLQIFFPVPSGYQDG